MDGSLIKMEANESLFLFNDYDEVMGLSFRSQHVKDESFSWPKMEESAILTKSQAAGLDRQPQNWKGYVRKAPSVTVLGVGKRGPLDRQIQNKLLEWMYHQHQEPLTSTSIRGMARQLFCPKYPSFKGSRGWYYNFLKRHNFDRTYIDPRQ